MASIGGIEFLVVEETPLVTNTITDRPVEGGVIADNIRNNPIMLTVTGAVVDDTAPEKIKAIWGFAKNKDIIGYSGRTQLTNCAIESVETSHTYTNKKGFGFTITLKEIIKATVTTIAIEDITATQVREDRGVGEITRVPFDTTNELMQPEYEELLWNRYVPIKEVQKPTFKFSEMLEKRGKGDEIETTQPPSIFDGIFGGGER